MVLWFLRRRLVHYLIEATYEREGERGGERERENHGNNKWVLMIFHGQQNVGLQFNIHQFEKLMQRLKSKESQSLHKSIHCNLEHFHLLNQGSINHINTQTRRINH